MKEKAAPFTAADDEVLFGDDKKLAMIVEVEDG